MCGKLVDKLVKLTRSTKHRNKLDQDGFLAFCNGARYYGSYTLHRSRTGTGTGKRWVSIWCCVLYTLQSDRDRYMEALFSTVPILFPVPVPVPCSVSEPLQVNFPLKTSENSRCFIRADDVMVNWRTSIFLQIEWLRAIMTQTDELDIWGQLCS